MGTLGPGHQTNTDKVESIYACCKYLLDGEIPHGKSDYGQLGSERGHALKFGPCPWSSEA